MYEFDWETPVAGLGACHALELAFVFDTLATGALMAGESAPQSLAEQMHRAWWPSGVRVTRAGRGGRPSTPPS